MTQNAFLELKTHKLHYRIDGDVSVNAAAPWLLFCNSLGTDLHMWDAQVQALSAHFRVLRYDRRGHGASTTPPAPYSLADLGGDVIALLDALNIEHTHFCGLSIGGMVGQWLGIHHGQRFGKLLLCATAAKIGTEEGWNARIEAVKSDGLAPMTAATAERWFTPRFNAEHADVVNGILKQFVAVDPVAYNGCCSTLAGADLRDELTRIVNPVLVISGDDDPVCPPQDLRAIANAVQDGRHASFSGRHIVNIESALLFNAVVKEFLQA